MKRSTGEIVFNVFNSVFMAFLIMITLYPFLYVAFASFSDPNLMMRQTGLLLYPAGYSLASYKAVFRNPMITIGYFNTLIVVVIGTSINVLFTSMGAYVLSRKKLYWKKLFMVIVVITMFFSGGLIPLYLVILNLGMINTRWALIIPSAISTYNMIIMRTYFLTIPDEIEESAVMDGAHDLLILFRIIVPLATPIIAVMILFYGVGHWNSWFSAMIYLQNRNLYPLQLVLREILIINSIDSMTTDTSFADRAPIAETIKYATIMVSTVPILTIYPFLQKHFVKGIMIGALKG